MKSHTGHATDSKPPNPLLRWAGGKASIASRLIELMPQNIDRYFEPFLGGGALFFRLSKASRLIGSDTNWQLIEFYKQVRDDPHRVLDHLREFRNNQKCFLEVRSWDRDRTEFLGRAPAERAARFFFLNRTCFNGLYRENSRGEFNVPFAGLKNPKINASEQILAASILLNETEGGVRKFDLSALPYEVAVSDCKNGDFVYFDPPYVPLSRTASFVGYQSSGFHQPDQLNLRDVAVSLASQGVRVMISNSDTAVTRDLYKASDGFHIATVEKRRNISAASGSRIMATEVIITNYKTGT